MLFAAGQTDINQNDFEVIFHTRKYLLFHSNQPWVKRDSDTFNVTAGASDAREICELVEIFMLSLISKISEHNILSFNSPYSKSIKTNINRLFLR